MAKTLGRKDIGDVIYELKKGLERLYQDRLASLILYGSYARNEAVDDSDVDVAVVLGGNVVPGIEIDRMLDILTDINLKYNTLISIYPVSTEDMRSIKSPLLMNIEKEGVRL